MEIAIELLIVNWNEITFMTYVYEYLQDVYLTVNYKAN